MTERLNDAMPVVRARQIPRKGEPWARLQPPRMGGRGEGPGEGSWNHEAGDMDDA